MFMFPVLKSPAVRVSGAVEVHFIIVPAAPVEMNAILRSQIEERYAHIILYKETLRRGLAHGRYHRARAEGQELSWHNGEEMEK
jgi:hypothetical protein